MDNEISVGGVRTIWTDCINCGVRYTVPKTMWDHQRYQSAAGALTGYPITDRKGGNIDEFPADLRVREWPA